MTGIRTVAVPLLAVVAFLSAPATLLGEPDRPGLLRSLIVEGPERDYECHECVHGCAHAKSALALIRRGLNPDGAPIAAAPPHPSSVLTDLLHNDLRIDIDPVAAFFDGSNTMTVRSLTDGLTTFRVRLDQVFTITALESGGSPVSSVRLDPATIEVTLDRAYDQDEVFTLKVGYAGFPQNNGFGSIAFGTQGGGTPVVSTLSETDFAFTWWPNKDDNRDKSTADLRFTVPSWMSVASNGVLMSVTDVGGGKSQWHWRTLYQTATYLYSLAATNYDRFSGSYDWGGGVMPLEFFIYPGSNTASNRNAWLLSGQMLASYRPIFGLYPFIDEKYGIYQFGFGGGMEHQTMTGQGTFSESVTAHEVAHQWWGNMITCAFWNDIWINEGFATYGEALWFEHKPGGSGAAALHSAMASRRPSSVNGTVYIPEPLDNANIARIFSTSFSYRKPAWVLHMLRRIVGDQTFFDILAAYRAAFEHGSADTEDFIGVAEAVTDRDLRWFFDPWIYSPGAPAYRRAWRQTTVGGQQFVELMVQQVQSSTYPIFTMPLDVVTTVGGVPGTTVIWNDAQTEWYVIPVPGVVSSLQLDPTPWVLATSNSTVTFIEGPPVVVATAPAPGEAAPIGSVDAVTVTFHKSVVSSPAHYTLVNDSTGPVAFTHSYNASTFTARLDLASPPLPPGDYTLTVLDDVRDVASSKRLDGELADPASPSSLPTGDGQPGGHAVVRFSVPPPVGCHGDADLDGAVGFADISSVLANWGAVYPPGQSGPGDADNSDAVDFADITAVLSAFGGSCG